MPIIINEIEISVEVASRGTSGEAGQTLNDASKEAIIKECIERVMDILTIKNER